MSLHQGTVKLEMREKLSTLWMVVMLNMAFADILSFMMEYSNGLTSETQATQSLMLIAAVLLEIPIVMIILSRVLKYRINRWVNIVASVITILFVIGGGSLYLHYLFFAFIEVGCMLLIFWYAWRWRPTPVSVS